MRNGQWLDDRLPSPDWSQPVTPFRVPVWVRALAGLLVLAGVVGLMVGAGGFEERTDQVQTRRTGSVMTVGPFNISVQHATVQRIQDWDESWTWEVRLQGTISNTWTESKNFEVNEFGWMAFREPRSKEIISAESFVVPNTSIGYLAPTDETMAAEWVGTFKNEPSAYLEVGILDLEYTDNSLLGFGDRVWNPADDSYRLFVPVIRLPDRATS